jgi:hypothetical protein
MHISELRAMTLIKNDNDVLLENFMAFVALDEDTEFLDGGYDNL